MARISGKTAVVTGASTGIGRATAEALARVGFTVFGTSRRPNGDAPVGVTMLACDVTDDVSVKTLVSAVLAKTGRIDLLVNNAGIGLIGGAEESLYRSRSRHCSTSTCWGLCVRPTPCFRRCASAAPDSIINMGSVLGIVPAPYSAYYSATKHALEGYSDSSITRRVPSISVFL